MSAQPWQEAFLGVSAVLGEPIEQSVGALDDRGAFRARMLLRGMRSSSRDMRALAIARAVAQVVAQLDEMSLR
jgi:hypothetical protein